MKPRWSGALLLLGVAAVLSACATAGPMPVGNAAVPQPAKRVDADRYLGRWYELYRYDAPFQKGCEAVSRLATTSSTLGFLPIAFAIACLVAS